MFKNNRNEDRQMGTNNFGRKITALRKEKGMTQAKLAEKINVSNKTISRWETGEGYPEITLLKPLATALETTVDDLLSEDEGTETPPERPHKIDEKKSKRFHINIGTESKYEQTTINTKALRKLHFSDFWKSLVIFNKVSFTCLVICILLLIVSTVMEFLKINSMFTIVVYHVLICSIGLFSSVLGLILDLLGCYKKQTLGYVVFAAVCFAGRYVFPWLTMLLISIFAG